MNIDNELWCIGNGILYEYKGPKDYVEELVIPEGVKKIHSYCSLPKKIGHLVLPSTLKEFQISEDINTVTLHSNNLLGSHYNFVYATHYKIHNHNDEETFKTIRKIANGPFVAVPSFTILDKKLEPEYLKESWESINAQKGCRGAKLVNVDYNEFEIVDGKLIGYNGDDEEIFIPEGVKVICRNIFTNPKIKSIILPSTLEIIGDCAFYNLKLTSLYLPDNVNIIGCMALGKIDELTSLSYNIAMTKSTIPNDNKFNTNHEELIIPSVEIRATSLKEINPEKIIKCQSLSISLQEEITLEELREFYKKLIEYNKEFCYSALSEFTITVISQNKEKTKYFIKDEKIEYIVIGPDLEGIDLEILNSVSQIFIDNTSGKSISSLIDYLLKCEAKEILPNLNSITIIGLEMSKKEKRTLNSLLRNFFGSMVKYEHTIEDKVHSLNNFRDNTGIKNISVFDKEIEDQIAKLNSIIAKLEEKDRISILAKINNLLKKYNFDLKKSKPKLEFGFSENADLIPSEKDAKYLKKKLIYDLETIFNTLNANDYYNKLQEDLNEYEAMLMCDQLTIPESITSIKDEIVFIIIKAKFYNKLDFILALEKIFADFKSKVSSCIVALTEDRPRLENLDSSFTEEINKLYISLKRIICIEDIFNDIKTSELARNIITIKNIILKFDNYHQIRYLAMLDNLLNKYYNLLTINDNSDIMSAILELRKELNPFLEELKTVAPTYIALSDIFNTLHNSDEQKNISKVISDTIREVTSYINNSPLTETEKEEAQNEIKQVLNKWKSKIENQDLSFEDKPDILNTLYKIPPRIPFSNIDLETELRIVKDLLSIKYSIEYYLTSQEDYNETLKIQ